MSSQQPLAMVCQYSNSTRWFIQHGPLADPDKVPDWSTCPGTLYEDYETAAEACQVARWWGYDPFVGDARRHV